MAVYKRGYRRYAGPLTGRWTRFMVLPRYAWRRLYQQRLVLLLTMAAFVWPLLCAFFVYLTNHAELLQGLEPEFREFIQVDGRFFSIFMYVQGACAVFLAALAGPGLVAPDLANNALPLYFSRPLTRWSYGLARLTVIVGMLSVVTWIPGLILFGLQVGLAGGWWFLANWTLGAGLVTGFLLWLLILGLVAMASSAYVKWRVVAGAISLAGGNIIDARIHTTGDGMALDNILVQDLAARPLSDRHQLERLERGAVVLLEAVPSRHLPPDTEEVGAEREVVRLEVAEPREGLG